MHPLGVKTHDGKLDVILEGDSAVPCRGKRLYHANEGDVVIEVFEGKRETEVIATPPTPPTSFHLPRRQFPPASSTKRRLPAHGS